MTEVTPTSYDISDGQAQLAAVPASLRRFRWELIAVASLVVVMAGILSWFAVQRHLAFQTGFDLGVYTQVLWTTAHGRPFYQTLMEGTNNFLTLHFVPLLALLAPIYAIWPDARTLLILQAILLASGAIPLWGFARPRLGSTVALLLILAYWVSPLVHFVALADFHEIALAVPLLMAAGAALLNERPRATFLWLGLALLVKEEIALVALGFGLYALLVQRRWRFGVTLLGFGMLWAVLLVKVFFPALLSSGGGSNFARHYGALGATPEEMLRTLVTHPLAVVPLVFTESKLLFLSQLFGPLALLPLVGLPASLLMLPSLAYLLLGADGFLASIQHHYTAVLIPFLFLSAAWGLQRLGRWKPHAATVGAWVLLLASVLGYLAVGPLPGSRSYVGEEFAVTDETRSAQALLSSIPATATVAADMTYQPWLANRWWFADIGTPPFAQFDPAFDPDYVVAHVPGPYAVSAPVYPWLIRDSGANPLRISRFELSEATPGGTAVWKRLDSVHDLQLQRYDATFEDHLKLLAAGTPPESVKWSSSVTATVGSVLPIWMVWGADGEIGRQITFSLHLVDDSQRIVAQIDQEMGAGRFPTTQWRTWVNDPVVASEFPLKIPPGTLPGQYTLLAGAYDSKTMTPLVQPGKWEPWLPLANVVVLP